MGICIHQHVDFHFFVYKELKKICFFMKGDDKVHIKPLIRQNKNCLKSQE